MKVARINESLEVTSWCRAGDIGNVKWANGMSFEGRYRRGDKVWGAGDSAACSFHFLRKRDVWEERQGL